MTQTTVENRTEEKTKSSKPESKGHILTIDDDDHIRSIFASYLENFGYQIKMAKDGNEAKTLLERDEFDIALLDICLPDCNGFDLLKEIKQIQPELNVIVCTAYSDNYDFLEAVNAGAADWIPKPCNLQELHAKVERIQREQNQRQELSKKNSELEVIKKETDHILKSMKLMLQNQKVLDIQKNTKIRDDFPEIIGCSKKIEDVLELVHLVANTSSSVLITGESGTGKGTHCQAHS